MQLTKLDNTTDTFAVIDGVGCRIGHINTLTPVDKDRRWVFNAIQNINMEAVELRFIASQIEVLQESEP